MAHPEERIATRPEHRFVWGTRLSLEYCNRYNAYSVTEAGLMKYTILWDLDADPGGNVQHIAQHGLTKEEVEEVLENPAGADLSRTSGLPIAFGETSTGRLIAVVYQEIGADTLRPITAYDLDE